MRSLSMRDPSHRTSISASAALRLHRTFLRCALGMVHIYAWIFVFEYLYYTEQNLSHALSQTILLYALAQIVITLMTPFAARYLRFGTRRSLIFGTAFVACAWVLLNATFASIPSAALASTALVAFAIMLGVYRALYWIPYEVESEAVQAPAAPLGTQLIIALTPLAGGLIIAGLVEGPTILLLSGALLVAISAVSLLFVRDLYERFSWGYRETFGKLFARENYEIVRESFFDGISGGALLFFWPFAIFFLVDKSYDTLGAILAATFVVAILFRKFVRRILHRVNPGHAPVLHTVLAVTPWLMRVAVTTPLGMVLVDSYFYTTTQRRLGADPFIFEQVADGGTYVDEMTALKEIALALGRITLSVFAAFVLTLASVPTMFVLVMFAAAVASAATLLWSQAK